jgi:hypothetical protein
MTDLLLTVSVLFLLLFSGNKQQERSHRFFFAGPFRPDAARSISKFVINFNDSIPNDTLKLYFSDEELPAYFSREISTAVCLDSVCRLVDITIYWEVTGRFIGYSFPSDKELSKKEHVPFKESDYEKLSKILGDSLSPLKIYKPDRIIPPKHEGQGADAITGATMPNVLPWIVPEAAYTSCTLWHITYGPTRDSIIALTKQHLLSGKLLKKLLQEDNPYNQITAFHWMECTSYPKDEYTEIATKILHGKNYNASGEALKFLMKAGPRDGMLEMEMIQFLINKDFRYKNFAIDYLNSLWKISQPVAREMLGMLKCDNYYLVNVVLTILAKKYQADYQDQHHLLVLLKCKNFNISNRVYSYLADMPNPSPDIARQLKHFKRHKSAWE